MRFFSAVSDTDVAATAVQQVIDEVTDAAETAGSHLRADVAFLFLTGQFRDDAQDLLERVWLELDPQTIIGCSGEGVIGGDREIERQPGVSLLVAEMPDVRLHPFHISGEAAWREVLTDPEELIERVGYGPETRGVIGFGDPFTTPIDPLLKAFDQACPHAPLSGGMASAARQPGGNVLFRNDQVFDEGFVGLSFSGPLKMETIVSQGCRPIGRPFVITKANENVIAGLGGKPALEALREVVNGLSEDDEAHLANGLFLGRAMTEYRDKFGRGDFLVRNVIGVDEDEKSVSVADYVRVGQTVQFHVRDAATASEDLSIMLRGYAEGSPPAGGMLFSCNGRGSRLFNASGHDISLAKRQLPIVPVAGFFAGGEFGPVGGKNFIHGHTASFAFFRPE